MFDTLNKDFSRVQGTMFPGHALPWTDLSEGDNLLAVVQLTHFDCGGIAINLYLTHKLADGYTISKLLNGWGELARNSTFLANPPGSSLLQPKDDPFTANFYEVANKRHLNVLRLTFNRDNINRLKDIVSSESNVKDPTRFEVVAGAVNICAPISAGNSNSSSSTFDPFTIYIPMNLRKLVNPPVPNLVGNFISFALVHVSYEGELKLAKMVSKIRKGKKRNKEKYQGKNKVEVSGEVMEEARVFPVDINNLRLTTSLYQTVALQFKNDKDLLQFASIDLCY
ncbi:hypothetical protein LIER_41747 [Lithospermum erythrorhizon]|uniref:Uncharacterized protein n=1 Tax=Lithospermum erythrorhizon TaxID=34254 RepID=A0AAV3RHT6_LITER